MPVRDVTAVIRQVAHEGDRVTPENLVDATGLDPANAELTMGMSELVPPFRAKWVLEPSEDD